MADYTMPYKGRMTIRAGASTDMRNGRNNRRIKAWDLPTKPNTTVEKLEKAFLASLVAVDRVAHRRDESSKSGRFTAEGVSGDVLNFALSDAVPALGRGRAAIREAKRVADELRAKTQLRDVETADPWKAGLMLRVVDQFRGMTQEQRDALTRNPDKLDGITVDALLAAPASLTGISQTHRQQLVDRAMQAQHGDAIAELQTLERAIEVCENAVEASRDEVRLEAGVTDRSKFDQLAAPIEQKVSGPWLKKFEGGALNGVRRIEREEGKESFRAPLATPADLENGVFAETYEAYCKLTGRAA